MFGEVGRVRIGAERFRMQGFEFVESGSPGLRESGGRVETTREGSRDFHLSHSRNS